MRILFKKISGRRIRTIVLLLFFSIAAICSANKHIKITLKPNQKGLITATLQQAIDSCAKRGGGVVIFPAGKYQSGSIQLKSKVSLQLNKDAVLQGSDKYSDYSNDAFIFGKDISNIAIQGEGIIDGVNCQNSRGEEGFRGPHCIRLVNCSKIQIKDITIKNSANWAINCKHSSFASIQNVKIRGGHDGLHTRFCSNFVVKACDFRTGDDAFAGNDNKNFTVTDCKINTSCNGFRIGCQNFRVERCHLWGPGEYAHKISKRNNMITAFVHFSPDDEPTKIKSGNWIIKDITIDNVDFAYLYNFNGGLWQTGQPVNKVRFENIQATNLKTAISVNGGKKSEFELIIKNSSFGHRKGQYFQPDIFEGVKLVSGKFFDITNFKSINLSKVTFDIEANDVVINCNKGEKVRFKKVKIIPNSTSNMFKLKNIKEINNRTLIKK